MTATEPGDFPKHPTLSLSARPGWPDFALQGGAPPTDAVSTRRAWPRSEAEGLDTSGGGGAHGTPPSAGHGTRPQGGHGMPGIGGHAASAALGSGATVGG
jgi:hypothetical protein